MSFFQDLFTGGAYSRNKAAKKAQKTQEKNIEANYEFQWGDSDSDELGGEALRKYEYNVEGLEITKRNQEANLAYQEANLVQAYDFQMGIRNYEYSQAVRAYDQSVSRAVRQEEFNDTAEQFALLDQDRLIHEQLLSLDFDRQETILNYRVAAAGFGMEKRQAKTKAAIEAQATRVSALKAQGAAGARGQSGRSAAKDIQGIVAEAGARQGAIIEQFMYDTESSERSLFGLNNQFLIDKAGYETSVESAKMTDTAARNKIKLQRLQAAINAEASIALKPEIGPPLPIPFALPRPEYQDIFMPEKPPMTDVPSAPQENLFAAGLNTVGSIAVGAVTGGLGGFGATAAGSWSTTGALVGGARGLFG